MATAATGCAGSVVAALRIITGRQAILTARETGTAHNEDLRGVPMIGRMLNTPNLWIACAVVLRIVIAIM